MPKKPINFSAILRTLSDHKVDFIVVGGVSAVLQGAPIATFDLDIVPSRSRANLKKLTAALHSMDAFYREHPTKRLRPTSSALASPGHHLLLTEWGPLDVLGTVGDSLGYEELFPMTLEQRISRTYRIRLLDLPTLIMLKEQLARDKDRAVLHVLRRTWAERLGQEQKPPE